MTFELTTTDIYIILNVLSNVDHFKVKGCGDWMPEIKRIQEKLVTQHNQQVKIKEETK